MDCCTAFKSEFKIDTGADVTVIPTLVYKKSCDGPLVSPNRVLHGPSQHTLSVVGKFVGNLKLGNITVVPTKKFTYSSS